MPMDPSAVLLGVESEDSSSAKWVYAVARLGRRAARVTGGSEASSHVESSSDESEAKEDAVLGG
jgi:hypothetical protein